jgi:hypothetical protein
MALGGMLGQHVSLHLVAYADGQVEADVRRRVDAHLAGCARCRQELEGIQSTAGLLRRMALVRAPDTLWPSIEGSLRARPAHVSVGRPGPAEAGHPGPAEAGHYVRHRWLAAPTLRWPMAAAVIAVLAGAGYWKATRATWDVIAPGATVASRLAEGSWIETTTSSRARITVGTIGTVDVEPGSRVRLGSARDGEYRIALERGTISAEIVAPPRLFFVDTPTSTVVDLGCAYTMHVDEGGAGELRVTNGWASLEWNGRESLVPAGARGRTRPGADPGTPFFEDASPELQAALDTFDFNAGGAAALDIVLTEARVRDTLTLWHLVSRVDPRDRARVVDRIAALTPLPATVSRDKAVALDPVTLTRWREELAWTW